MRKLVCTTLIGVPAVPALGIRGYLCLGSPEDVFFGSLMEPSVNCLLGVPGPVLAVVGVVMVIRSLMFS